MRLSRPCYDKPHRCPGWAGGGMHSARVYRCTAEVAPGGGTSLRAGYYYEHGLLPWSLRFSYHRPCRTLVLPYVVRWLDPGWWRWELRGVRRWCRDRREERHLDAEWRRACEEDRPS